MRRLFYCTRNIVGLILVISPLAGFLYIDYNFTHSMIFLCSIAAGIPLGSACYRLINFRLWTGLACIGVCLGALLLRGEGALEGAAAAKAVGMAFVGFYAGGLAAVVPANLMVNWFRASKTLLLGAVFSISITAGALLTALMERHTYLTLSLSLIMMLTAGAMSVAGCRDALVCMVLQYELLVFWLFAIIRTAQILSSKQSILATILYLCGLEFIPAAVLITAALVF